MSASTSQCRDAPRSATVLRGGAKVARREQAMFWWLRNRLVWRMVAEWATSSRLRMSILVGLSLLFWLGLFAVFHESFVLLANSVSHEPTRAMVAHKIFNIFFFALLIMLAVSSGIIMYSALFRSDEVRFLLTQPISVRRIVSHKFQEAVAFSAWGFLLMGSPMLIAYGMSVDAPLYFYAMLVPMLVSFVVIPAACGGLACMGVIYVAPRFRLRLIATLVAALVAAGLYLGLRLFVMVQENLQGAAWLSEMMGRMEFAEQRLLPSWWLSSGLLQAAHNEPASAGDQPWRDSVMFLGLLVSNAMMATMVLVEIGHRALRPCYSRLQGMGGSNRRARSSVLDRLVRLLAWPLPPATRLLIEKDVRLFRRDPVQWSQFAIFFGLLALYFINIRRFQYDDGMLLRWMNMIGFLNLAVVGLILSTFTTRFIFPMISLEGRRFWILGTLPIHRETILWSKFWFAGLGSAPPCAALIFISDWMLGIVATTPVMALIHQVTCWSLCLGLAGIAVGLGARLPDMRQNSPARIAAGYGGTLNLVLSGIFIVLTVLMTAAPSYFVLEARDLAGAHRYLADTPATHFLLGSNWALAAGVAATVLLGAVATIVPLNIGIRAFRRLEF